ncbi:MAG TPA: ribosomal protein S18-alanine N-acetyltransferase [Cellulomonas sp.]|uniref:ribosomal protein S18-alanine N-acetyltransferase n=1 Tax=Cellulomonas sp. TaxID=40001 RepID=UPI002E35A685|nr:ribosomal protein S18-alanine N-acetyltransferase [Cellulomonas sp.]HEX5332477.1 ribosomal protein S18-alanine N-acetyltransferase [Cellulomonas sp.]
MTEFDPGVVVRPLTTADLPALDTFERELFGPGAWSRAALAEELHGPGRWYVGGQDVATGELVGYAGLSFDGVDAEVMTIGTTTGHQRRGVGSALLAALLGHAREVGAANVYLEVRVDNDSALRLYERAGFVRMGRRRGYYQPENVDAWTMSLALSHPAAPAVPGDDDKEQIS